MNPLEHARQSARIQGFTLTTHALKRMVEFRLTRMHIEEMLFHYDCRYQQTDRGDQAFIHKKGPWAIAVDHKKRTIITVLRNQPDRWEH